MVISPCTKSLCLVISSLMSCGSLSYICWSTLKRRTVRRAFSCGGRTGVKSWASSAVVQAGPQSRSISFSGASTAYPSWASLMSVEKMFCADRIFRSSCLEAADFLGCLILTRPMVHPTRARRPTE